MSISTDTDKLQMAENLLELWGQYIDSLEDSQQATMWDFMQWLRQQVDIEYGIPSSDQHVKEAENRTALGFELAEDGTPISGSPKGHVKDSKPVEASVVKGSLEGLTKDQKRDIRNLYYQGYSLARVRQMLGLKVGLTAMQGAVRK